MLYRKCPSLNTAEYYLISFRDTYRMADRTTLTDPERTRHRLEIMNLAFKGLLAIHGGGAVALLAFLQAVISTNPALAKIVLVGISCLGIGLFMAVIFMTFRYHTSLEDQRQSGNWKVYRTVSSYCYKICQRESKYQS